MWRQIFRSLSEGLAAFWGFGFYLLPVSFSRRRLSQTFSDTIGQTRHAAAVIHPNACAPRRTMVYHLCYSGNQVLGTNTCDTVPGTDGNRARGRERASSIHRRVIFVALKYFDVGHDAMAADDHSFPKPSRRLLILPKRIARIWSPRPKHTRALRLVPWRF